MLLLFTLADDGNGKSIRGVGCLYPHTHTHASTHGQVMASEERNITQEPNQALCTEIGAPRPDGNSDCIQHERSARQAQTARQRRGGNTNAVAAWKIDMEVYQRLHSKWQFVGQNGN